MRCAPRAVRLCVCGCGLPVGSVYRVIAGEAYRIGHADAAIVRAERAAAAQSTGHRGDR